MSETICCTPKSLPREEWMPAAATAIHISPANRPRLEKLMRVIAGFVPGPDHLAVLTSKFWGAKGVRLTVGFLDNPPADLRAKILLHMNAWGSFANVQFVATNNTPAVRIARHRDGYWSYLGTDILHISTDEPTLNLQGFTMATPESEFVRVIRHETGHTLGFPHEHLRRELVNQLDVAKTLAYFERTQGWSAAEVRAQVLTPIEEGSLLGLSSEHADAMSIMCYQLPGSITRDGQPIVGGVDIDQVDRDVASKVYPLPLPPPPPPPPADNTITLSRPLPAGNYRVTPV